MTTCYVAIAMSFRRADFRRPSGSSSARRKRLQRPSPPPRRLPTQQPGTERRTDGRRDQHAEQIPNSDKRRGKFRAMQGIRQRTEGSRRETSSRAGRAQMRRRKSPQYPEKGDEERCCNQRNEKGTNGGSGAQEQMSTMLCRRHRQCQSSKDPHRDDHGPDARRHDSEPDSRARQPRDGSEPQRPQGRAVSPTNPKHRLEHPMGKRPIEMQNSPRDCEPPEYSPRNRKHIAPHHSSPVDRLDPGGPKPNQIL